MQSKFRSMSPDGPYYTPKLGRALPCLPFETLLFKSQFLISCSQKALIARQVFKLGVATSQWQQAAALENFFPRFHGLSLFCPFSRSPLQVASPEAPAVRCCRGIVPLNLTAKGQPCCHRNTTSHSLLMQKSQQARRIERLTW